MQQKIALITGGCGGIGSAICHQLAKQDIQPIAADYIQAEQAQQWQQAQKAQGLECSVYPVDVTNLESCQQMVNEIQQQYGRIDILVNNAGITRDNRFIKMPAGDWQAVINTNLNSMYNVTHPVLELMLAQNYGRIVNISSVNGAKGQFGQTNYASAKAGIYGFTKSLAQEVARKGITVNSISPGYVETKMTLAVREDILNSLIETIPMQRLAKPEEIAWAVSFLADERSAYITGTDIAVNGGFYM
jgi:acetoacetyl-CoA reductase